MPDTPQLTLSWRSRTQTQTTLGRGAVAQICAAGVTVSQTSSLLSNERQLVLQLLLTTLSGEEHQVIPRTLASPPLPVARMILGTPSPYPRA